MNSKLGSNRSLLDAYDRQIAYSSASTDERISATS